MRHFSWLAVVLIGCSGEEPAKKDEPLPKKDEQKQEKPKPKPVEKPAEKPPEKPDFSESDPQRTVRWLHELSKEWHEAQANQNAIAIKRAEANITEQLAKFKGKSISWPTVVSGVTKDGPGVIPIGYPYDYEVTEKVFEGLAPQTQEDMFPTTSLHIIEARRVKGLKDLQYEPELSKTPIDVSAKLKRYSPVTAKGVIHSIAFKHGAHFDKKFSTFSVRLEDPLVVPRDNSQSVKPR